MNVSTAKTNFSYSANKVIACALVALLNLALVYVNHNTVVEYFGKVEALDNQWSNYVNLHKNYIDSRVIYSKLDSGEANTHAINYRYEYAKSKGGDYIALGFDKPMTIRHNRVYYIDDQCSLIFSARAKLTLNNVSMRCSY